MFTYDITQLATTPLYQIRLRINDTDSSNAIFHDEELLAFYAIEGESVKLACAYALETIADNEVLVLKVIKIMQLSTDGAKVADSLRKSAKLLRDQVAAVDPNLEPTFEIAEYIVDDFSLRQYLSNQYARLP